MLPRSLLLLLLASVTSCHVPALGGVDEGDANRALVQLEQDGIPAQKQPDPDVPGRFTISVPPSEATRAAAALSDAGLPQHRNPGLLDALGAGGLVPSRQSEHVRMLAGVAGDLERSLAAVAGVASARVHLAAPLPDTLRAASPTPPTAAVLLACRGEPSISVEDVQRLVAAAVPDLSPDRVTVVRAPVAQAKPGSGPAFLQLGPIAVSRASATSFKLMVGTLLVLNFGLGVCTLILWRRQHPAAPSDGQPAQG